MIIEDPLQKGFEKAEKAKKHNGFNLKIPIVGKVTFQSPQINTFFPFFKTELSNIIEIFKLYCILWGWRFVLGMIE